MALRALAILERLAGAAAGDPRVAGKLAVALLPLLQEKKAPKK